MSTIRIRVTETSGSRLLRQKKLTLDNPKDCKITSTWPKAKFFVINIYQTFVLYVLEVVTHFI